MRLQTVDPWKVRVIVASNPECDSFSDRTPQASEKFRMAVDSSAARVAGSLRKFVKVPKKNITILRDFSSDGFRAAVRAQAEDAGDDLEAIAIYYIGHGAITDKNLYLLNSSSNMDNIALTSVPIKDIHEAINSVDCELKVMVLDCCDGGRGLFGLESGRRHTSEAEIAEAGFVGAYGMAAAAAGWPAWIPRNSDETAFSKAFCDVLENGIDNFELHITIDAFFRELRSVLLARDQTRPLRVSSIDDERIALCNNQAYSPEKRPIQAIDRLTKGWQKQEKLLAALYERLEGESERVRKLRAKRITMQQSLRSASAEREVLKEDVSGLKRRVDDIPKDLRAANRQVFWLSYSISVITVAAVAFVFYLLDRLPSVL